MSKLTKKIAFVLCFCSTAYCTEVELLWTAPGASYVSWNDEKLYLSAMYEGGYTGNPPSPWEYKSQDELSYLKSDSVKPDFEIPPTGYFLKNRPVLGNSYMVYQNIEAREPANMGPGGSSRKAFFGVRGKYNWSYGGNYLSSNPYHIPNDQFLVTINGRELRKYDAATQKILTNINGYMHAGVTMRPRDSRIIGDGKTSVCISFENARLSNHNEKNESVVLVCFDSRSMEERWRTDTLFKPQNCLATDTHIIGNNPFRSNRAFSRDLVAINFLTGETDWIFQAEKEIVGFKHIDYLQRIVIQDQTAVYFISQSGKLLDKYTKPERPLNQTSFYLHGSDSIGKYYGLIHGSSTHLVILKKTEDSWGLSLKSGLDAIPRSDPNIKLLPMEDGNALIAHRGGISCFSGLLHGFPDSPWPFSDGGNRLNSHRPRTLVNISKHPDSALIGAGNSSKLTVETTSANATYQWLKNGIKIPGATQSEYTLSDTPGQRYGEYSVIVRANSSAALSRAVTVEEPRLEFSVSGTALNIKSISKFGGAIERSNDLVNWVELINVSAGESETSINTASGERGYFRLKERD
ncbi:hypothetical protein N8584_00095 [bacterium]|nr:hypothetical protein [bacterium]MDA7680005.1 hypothetical protein [bacterium]